MKYFFLIAALLLGACQTKPSFLKIRWEGDTCVLTESKGSDINTDLGRCPSEGHWDSATGTFITRTWPPKNEHPAEYFVSFHAHTLVGNEAFGQIVMPENWNDRSLEDSICQNNSAINRSTISILFFTKL